jgi:hypothetical protein
MKKWEYIREVYSDFPDVSQLNELGKEGWEVFQMQRFLTSPESSELCCVVYVKREIKDESI